MEETSFKIKSYGKDGVIKKVEWLMTLSDGTTEYQQGGTVPIETTLSSSASESEIIEATKAQIGAASLAQIQAEANHYKINKQSEEDSATEYVKSTLTAAEEKAMSPVMTVTNFDFIMALQDKGHYDTVNNWVTNSGTDKQKLFWKISPMYSYSAPLSEQILDGAGLSTAQQKELYQHALSLKNYRPE
tara:strand:- start:2651 stop:3214 length:564 start_codon:yes stop_codon:yes gene_type:complete